MVHIGRIALDRIVEIRAIPLLSSCLRKASAAACPAYWVMTTEPTKIPNSLNLSIKRSTSWS